MVLHDIITTDLCGIDITLVNYHNSHQKQYQNM